MPTIVVTDIHDVVSALAQMEPLADQLSELSGDSLLIAAAGFEDRSQGILAAEGSDRFTHAILIKYETNRTDNRPVEARFAAWGESRSIASVVFRPDSFFANLRQELKRIAESSKKIKVVIDVTGMASYVMFDVLLAVCDTLPDAELSVVYFEAETYYPTADEWKRFRAAVPNASEPLTVAQCFEEFSFQSRGVDNVFASQTFPGRNPGPLATRLVAMPSFSLERVKALLANAREQFNIDLGDVCWIFGDPPDKEKNGWRLEALTQLYEAEVHGDVRTASTLNYLDMLLALDRIWNEVCMERHLVIAPIGSKMQHLGAFLFLCIHPDVGLLFCAPREFVARSYSSGVGTGWCVRFGTVSVLLSSLRRCGQLKFRW